MPHPRWCWTSTPRSIGPTSPAPPRALTRCRYALRHSALVSGLAGLRSPRAAHLTPETTTPDTTELPDLALPLNSSTRTERAPRANRHRRRQPGALSDCIPNFVPTTGRKGPKWSDSVDEMPYRGVTT